MQTFAKSQATLEVHKNGGAMHATLTGYPYESVVGSSEAIHCSAISQASGAFSSMNRSSVSSSMVSGSTIWHSVSPLRAYAA
ncbi:hypothetical protein [Sorangium sp. So ce362]|uniref:hypothetical protein n=1 Tax=Sorangium sp. So ce362 TaxID=3133303 RepID=UPI003F5FD9E4